MGPYFNLGASSLVVALLSKRRQKDGEEAMNQIAHILNISIDALNSYLDDLHSMYRSDSDLTMVKSDLTSYGSSDLSLSAFSLSPGDQSSSSLIHHLWALQFLLKDFEEYKVKADLRSRLSKTDDSSIIDLSELYKVLDACDTLKDFCYNLEKDLLIIEASKGNQKAQEILFWMEHETKTKEKNNKK